MKKLTNRQKQAIETKLKIIEKSLELFKTQGYDTVTVKDICGSADISIGSFYYHFKAKEDVINIGYKQIDLLIEEKIESQEFDNYIEEIYFILGEASVIIEELGWSFMSQVYKQLISTKDKYTLKENRYIYLVLKETINNAIKNKELTAELNSHELTSTILRISRGAIFDWCLNEGNYPLRDQIFMDLNLLLSNFMGKNSNKI
jgi:AcrR family transcriptional regulator